MQHDDPDSDGTSLSLAEVAFVQRFLLENSGNVISLEQGYLVESKLLPVADRLHMESVSHLVAELDGNAAQLGTDVVDALTNNETGFILADPEYRACMEEVISSLIASLAPDRPLIIWSAACSIGQEALSVAIIMCERFPELVEAGRVRILATDLSPTSIRRCAEARYSRIEIARGLPSPLRRMYFEEVGRDWVAAARLRKLIRVKVLNLMGPWPGMPRCDMVIMRNVLASLAPRVALQVAQKSGELLHPHGVLVAGGEDDALLKRAGFQHHGQATSAYYRLPGGHHDD